MEWNRLGKDELNEFDGIGRNDGQTCEQVSCGDGKAVKRERRGDS